ncbi:RNA-directed DNA polymerase, eukaryota, reverse transcriptase zinc-binding domain protein [Tanacetum coccineum]
MILNSAYREAALDEEKVLKKKSKIDWLKEGDHNSSFFHNMLKGKKNKSRIMSVKDDIGNEFHDDEVAEKFVTHFQNFLGSCDEIFPIDMPKELFEKKVDVESALHMVRDDIVGDDLCATIQEFFKSGKMLGELNTTLISLVPKCILPSKVTDYRPITCCNVVYKCISKVISNRIKVVLNELIDPNQSAFIEGRQIFDNILLAQELMCGYMSKNKVARCTFKVDVQKDYDTVSLDFLEFCLISFGFHKTMVNWIMVCLKSASFSVCINGESHGFFKAKRGLRQGDPVSLYLFTIFMEVFTLMLRRQVKNEKKFKYHWGCKELKILNLYFVDDLVMFCHGDMISASVMRRALDEFCLSSGLRPSMAKSTVYIGNVPNDVKEEIKSVMPFCEGTLPVKYLGIPLNSSMIVNNDCTVLFEKIKKRVEDWRNKALSYAGRLQLIASVLSSLNKSEGGLGIKSMKVWNEVLMAKHLWNVIIDKDSIWVRWVRTTWLKNVSIWVVEPKKLNSWGWKQILRNGRKVSFWYDRWNDKSPLCNLINTNHLVYDSLARKIRVADLIFEDRWKLPRGWNVRFGEVFSLHVPKLVQEMEDKAI